MRITLKLFAHLARYLPPGAERNAAPVDVPEGATIQTVIEQQRIPPGECHIVLVDGVYVEPSARATRTLTADETLAIWPLVAGG